MLKNSIIRILILIPLVTGPSVPQERWYVFYPFLITHAPVLEQLLTEAYPQQLIRVFDDHAQFVFSVNKDKPDVVISKEQVIRQLNGYNPILKGLREKQKSETHILLSLDKEVSPSVLDEKSVLGIIGFSDMDNINKFIDECVHKKVTILTVKKPEDLVFLLFQEQIDCTIVPKKMGDYFRSTYNLEFYEVPLTGNDPDIITCAIREGKSNLSVRKEFTNDSGKIIAQLFGIDRWK
jgi:hypothetical protein